ncbi:phosphopantetheine-binding protein [Actinokineospora sp. 24-640]
MTIEQTSQAADAAETILEFVRGRYPQVEIDAGQDIFALGFVNSLFAMELVMFVEKTFTVTIPNKELQLDNFRSADSMAALVGRLAADPAERT